MELKPGYKQTEVGVIPEDWEVLPLDRITDPKRPISYGIVQTGRPVHNGVRCVRVVDLDRGRVDATNLITTSADISAAYKRTQLTTGDLVIALRGKIGELALIEPDLDGANLTRGVALIAPLSGYDSEYLLHCLSSPRSKKIIEKNLNGSALQEIPIAALRKIPAVTPPLVEQRTIAAALSDVDALISSLDQLIAKKRDIKQATMQQLLTGKHRLPGFSGEWTRARLVDVAQLMRESVTPGYFPEKLFVHFSLPAFDAGQTPAIETGSTIGSNKFKVREGAILVSKLNPRIPRVWAPDDIPDDSVASTEFLVLLPTEKVSRSFLYVVCSSPRFCEQMELSATGTTGSHQRIAPSDALQITVLMPTDKDEQVAIASVLSDMDAEIAALEQRLDKTRAMKQGMMQELLTGRLRLI